MSEFKEMLVEETGKDKVKKSPVTIYASAKQIPELSKWPLGKEYTFKARLVSKTESVDEDSEDHASFEVTSWEGSKKKEVADSEDEGSDDNSSEDDDEYDD